MRQERKSCTLCLISLNRYWMCDTLVAPHGHSAFSMATPGIARTDARDLSIAPTAIGRHVNEDKRLGIQR